MLWYETFSKCSILHSLRHLSLRLVSPLFPLEEPWSKVSVECQTQSHLSHWSLLTPIHQLRHHLIWRGHQPFENEYLNRQEQKCFTFWVIYTSTLVGLGIYKSIFSSNYLVILTDNKFNKKNPAIKYSTPDMSNTIGWGIGIGWYWGVTENWYW